MIHSLFILPLGSLGCGRLVDKSVGNHAVPIVLNIFYPATLAVTGVGRIVSIKTRLFSGSNC